MARSVITLAYDTHRNTTVVSLCFEKDHSLISKLKSIKGATWSQSRGFWYIPTPVFNLSEVFNILSPVAYLDYSAIANLPNYTGQGFEALNKEDNRHIPIENKASPSVDIYCDEKENTIYLSLPYKLKENFKKLEGAWWHPKLKQWSALDTEDNRKQLESLLQSAGLRPEYVLADVKERSGINTPKLINPVMPDERFVRHMQLENKAESTIKQYVWYVKWYLTVNRGKNPIDDPGEKVRSFLHDEILKRGYGKTSQNLALSALQNYYRIVYEHDLHNESIPRARQKRPLPKVLSEEEFIKIYKQCDNTKHQIILKLMYGCGLRRDEVCSLKTDDVSIDRELIFVKGKGSKYRPVNPGRRLIEDIKSYLEFAKPGLYLIEGQNKGKYSGTSIAKIVERLVEKAGIKRTVTPHMFRHTFATHHMEKGTELRLIQEALGHASSKTTEIYTRVSRSNIKKMRNLLDDMEI